MNAPLVYVLVINWNGREHLDACFESLQATTYGNVRFLLVDNASTDDSCACVRERFGGDARVEILALEENRGWSGGNNAGIERAREAGADYIFLLNNDTATDAEAISALVSLIEANAAIGALAPRMVLFDQPEILNSTGLTLSALGAAWDRGIGRFDGPDWHTHEPIAGVCGGAMFLRASALEVTGLLPEDFEIYLDDLDLCLRLWTAGYSIAQCPEAVVRHKFSATMGAGSRARYKYYLNTRNRFRIVLRHFPVRAGVLILTLLVLGEVRALGRGVLSGALWRVPAHARAWLSALAYLPVAARFRHAQGVIGAPAFWPLVSHRPLFCPQVVLPRNGWYPGIVHDGARVCPIARRAWYEVPSGALRVRLVNCYPSVCDARITLYLDDRRLGALHAATSSEALFEVDGGHLTVVAHSVFSMEETRAPMDAGAWLQLWCDGAPLM